MEVIMIYIIWSIILIIATMFSYIRHLNREKGTSENHYWGVNSPATTKKPPHPSFKEKRGNDE